MTPAQTNDVHHPRGGPCSAGGRPAHRLAPQLTEAVLTAAASGAACQLGGLGQAP